MRPVVIAGPTASGKSALALAIAERDGGWVINADALQVYHCWRVLTARPDVADERRAPHRLYGHVACDAAYSVGHWLRDLADALDAARAARARPVVVGGTGLYLEAATRGLHAVPPIPPDVRARSAAALGAGRIGALIDDLARGDPETLARIDRDNPMRVQRAWEVLTATGRSLSDWRRTTADPLLPEAGSFCVRTESDSDQLNNNITKRFQKMLERGAIAEAARFRAAGHDLAAPAGRALGAAELIAYLDGALSLDAATAAAVTATRRYAKRQRTWLRNRLAGWPALDPDRSALAQIPRD